MGDRNEDREEGSSLIRTLLTGAALAVFLPELLPGMAIGVEVMLAPRLLPVLGTVLRPVVNSAVRAGYAAASATREFAAEAGEGMQDVLAEARAELQSGAVTSRTRGRAGKSSRCRRAQG